MPVTRSALASRAARSTWSASAPSTMPLLDQPARELGDPLDLVGDGAELLVEDDPPSFFACSSSGTLRSCSQKKRASARRAASTRRLPSTIASPPSLASMLATQTNAGASSPSSLRAGEIFLVGAHGEHDHLARHVEEVGVEAAEQRHRPFGQAGILDHQPLVGEQRQPGFRRRGLGALADQPLALVLVDDDVAGAQLLDIVARRRRW